MRPRQHEVAVGIEQSEIAGLIQPSADMVSAVRSGIVPVAADLHGERMRDDAGPHRAPPRRRSASTSSISMPVVRPPDGVQQHLGRIAGSVPVIDDDSVHA